MKNFSVPGSYILGKTVLLDGLEGGFLTILLSWLYYDSFLAIPFLIPLIWFWHKERENVRREKRQELFRKMFREWILLLASSLTAGYSMENALVQSYQELCLMFPKGGIMQEELKMMLAKAGNNQRPEILFDELAEKYLADSDEKFHITNKYELPIASGMKIIVRQEENGFSLKDIEVNKKKIDKDKECSILLTETTMSVLKKINPECEIRQLGNTTLSSAWTAAMENGQQPSAPEDYIEVEK